MDKTNNNWNGKITIQVDHSISTLTKIHTDHFNMKQYPNKYKHKTDGSDRIVVSILLRPPSGPNHEFVAAHNWYNSLPPNLPWRKWLLYHLCFHRSWYLDMIWVVPLIFCCPQQKQGHYINAHDHSQLLYLSIQYIPYSVSQFEVCFLEFRHTSES